jgi:branched-chain amino acid transport system substrate-binding protein
MPQAEPEPAQPSLPSIEEDALATPSAQEGERILRAARDALRTGAFEEAGQAALEIVEDYPGLEGSSEALEILARSALALNESLEAVEASGRYLALLDAGHPAFGSAVLLNAQSLQAAGDPAGALARLLSLPAGGPSEGREFLREVAEGMEVDLLEGVVEGLSPSHPLRGVLATELAVSLFLSGQNDDAERWAEAALDGPLEPGDESLARGILAGDLGNILGEPVILGAILPQSGVSPGLLEYGLAVQEGAQVAVEEYRAELRRPVRLEVRDHGGDLDADFASVQELEAMGVVGIIGPLTQEFLLEAALARSIELPMVSPFASLAGSDLPGVLSLSGPDPGGAEFVAEYAWDLGLERVVVLRPETGEAGIDAEAFSGAFEELGGIISREIVYDPGATFFQAEFEQVGSLMPDGLFLPLAPEDIQLLAPQFTYYGLDTLGIQLLGTTGWTEDEVVLEVDSRHTDGVIASTTRISQDETEAYAEFRTRYEALFQKSLRSSVPAYGYDAARLLLQALRGNPRDGRELLKAMEEITDFPGATGHLSVVDGRIVRVPQLVRIQDHELIYITSHLH